MNYKNIVSALNAGQIRIWNLAVCKPLSITIATGLCRMKVWSITDCLRDFTIHNKYLSLSDTCHWTRVTGWLIWRLPRGRHSNPIMERSMWVEMTKGVLSKWSGRQSSVSQLAFHMDFFAFIDGSIVYSVWWCSHLFRQIFSVRSSAIPSFSPIDPIGCSGHSSSRSCLRGQSFFT